VDEGIEVPSPGVEGVARPSPHHVPSAGSLGRTTGGAAEPMAGRDRL